MMQAKFLNIKRKKDQHQSFLLKNRIQINNKVHKKKPI